MFAKNFYFVRHGETILNAAHKRQGERGRLTEKGEKQAFEVGLRLKNYNIKKIFCSTYERAMQTAEEINKTLQIKNIEYTPLLGERRNPSSIIGLHYQDPLTVKAINFMDLSYQDPNARWEDEENFQDLKNRALKCQEYIIERGSNKTLFVTHGIFLRMLLATMVYGKDLTVDQYVKLSIFNPADNAGITIVRYHPLRIFSKNKWEILAYNDSSVNLKSLKI